jgi:Lon protease-like protein
MARFLNDFPLFPVSVIVFPGEIQPLHVFEERYKQLIHDMGNDQEVFGIPYVKDGKMCLYGSGVVIHKILATSQSGEMDILVKGVNMFLITEMKEQLPGKLYAGGRVKILDEINDIAEAPLIEKFRDYKQQLSKINKDSGVTSGIITSNHVLDIAGQLPLENEEKYNIIKFKNKKQREKFLLNKLEFLQMINLKLEEVGYRFYLN